MRKRVNISVNDNGGADILIKNNLNIRVLVLFSIEVMCAFLGALMFIYLLMIDEDYPILMYLFLLGVIIVFLLMGFRYLKRITEKEIVSIGKDTLAIKRASLLNSKSTIYPIDQIRNMTFAGFPKYTDHPLKGESMDYLGFQTMDRQIQVVNQEGNISFDFEERTIFFGKELPSWDVEKINETIIKVTSNTLSISNMFQDDIEEAEG